MNRQLKGALLTLLGGLCWGASGSMGQYLFTYEGMDSRWLVPIRLGLAGIILFIYSLIRYGKQTFQPWKDPNDRRDLLIYGIAGISCCQFLYFTTIQLSTASMATILQDLSPVMILFTTCLLEKRRPSTSQVLAVLLAISGIVLLTTHGDFSHLSFPLTALITGILCAVCVTIYNVEPKNLLARYPVILLQSWAFLLGSALFMILFRPWTMHYVPSRTGCLGIAFVVLVGNVLAFPCYMRGVSLIGPSKSILYGFSEPVSAALISAIAMKTKFNLFDICGFLLIFFMLALISRAPKEKTP